MAAPIISALMPSKNAATGIVTGRAGAAVSPKTRGGKVRVRSMRW